MPVPTHKAGCRTLFCRPSTCQSCNQTVYHWSCTCGSNVLFDKLGEPWSQHPCFKAGQQVNAKPLKTYTYGVLSVMCMTCGKPVRKKDLDAHNYYTHGTGSRPKDSPKQSPTSEQPGRPSVSPARQRRSKTPPKIPTVICHVCIQHVARTQLHKHMQKHYPSRLPPKAQKPAPSASPPGQKLPNGTVSTRPMIECELCSIPIRRDRLAAHMLRVHTSEAESNKPGKKIKLREFVGRVTLRNTYDVYKKDGGYLVVNENQKGQLYKYHVPSGAISYLCDRSDGHPLTAEQAGNILKPVAERLVLLYTYGNRLRYSGQCVLITAVALGHAIVAKEDGCYVYSIQVSNPDKESR